MKIKMNELTLELVKELIDYNPETGVFIWKERDIKFFTPTKKRTAEHIMKIWNSKWAGKEAFTSDNGEGYLTGAILCLPVKAHRLAWFYMTGEWPEYIDHENGNRSDNRFSNLRNVSKAENARNQKRHVTNTSGVTGVSWKENLKCWIARIYVSAERIYLGSTPIFEEAVKLRRQAEIEHNYHEMSGKERNHYPKKKKR
jgi:hypothetical protein